MDIYVLDSNNEDGKDQWQEPCRLQTSTIPTLRLMDKILHDLKDSKLWELWYIPYIMGNAGFCPSTVF